MKKVYHVGKIYQTKNSGKALVLKDLTKGQVLVRFLDTGYEKTCLSAHLVRGLVKDNTVSYSKFATDEVYTGSNGLSYKVLCMLEKGKAKIQFQETGTILTVSLSQLSNQNIGDPNKRSFLGEGYLGFPRHCEYKGEALQLWQSMLTRCYGKRYESYKTRGIKVAETWKCFATFLDDLPKLDGFSDWRKFKAGIGEKMQLDKDCKIKGNLFYSKETCKFVTVRENMIEMVERIHSNDVS